MQNIHSYLLTEYKYTEKPKSQQDQRIWEEKEGGGWEKEDWGREKIRRGGKNKKRGRRKIKVFLIFEM